MVSRDRENEWGESHLLLTELFVQSISRGRDATGFAARTEPLDAPQNVRVITAKSPQPADEFVQTNPFWKNLVRQRCAAVLGHVRYATSGTPADNRNNHPFTARLQSGTAFSMVHNGIFLDVRETADRLSLELETECDSELACRLIAASRSFADGLYQCLRQIKGSMALAVLDHRTSTIWAARCNERPLWVCRLRGGRRTILCSTPKIICDAVQRRLGSFADRVESIYPLAAGYVHGLTTDGRLIAPYTTSATLEVL